jgi:uncharacterized Zn ribbon protein
MSMDEEIYYDEHRNIIDTPREAWTVEKTTDCNGNELQSWDTIIAIKWLPVKWWVDIKKWDKFNNIQLTDDITHVRASSKKNGKIFLKTEFFKRAG